MSAQVGHFYSDDNIGKWVSFKPTLTLTQPLGIKNIDSMRRKGGPQAQGTLASTFDLPVCQNHVDIPAELGQASASYASHVASPTQNNDALHWPPKGSNTPF